MAIANNCYRRTDKDCNRLATDKQPNDLNPDKSEDIFGNEWIDYNQTYVRSKLDSSGPKASQPKLNGEDYVRKTIDCNTKSPAFKFDAGAFEEMLSNNTAGTLQMAVLTDVNNQPKSLVCPFALRIAPVTIPDLPLNMSAFQFQSGVFVAREVGYTFLLSPEVNTRTIYD